MSSKPFWKYLILACVSSICSGLLIEAGAALANSQTSQCFLQMRGEPKRCTSSVRDEQLDRLFEEGVTTTAETSDLLRAALSADWFLFAGPIDYRGSHGTSHRDFNRSHGDAAIAHLLRTGSCYECDLRGVNLRGANLRGANLRGANLGGATLRGADLRGADFRGTQLRGTNFRNASLEYAYLNNADLRGANLRAASLGGADLRGADLRGANLWDTYLQGANLRNADFRGANVRGRALSVIHSY